MEEGLGSMWKDDVLLDFRAISNNLSVLIEDKRN
jgi:hypothetical protein